MGAAATTISTRRRELTRRGACHTERAARGATGRDGGGARACTNVGFTAEPYATITSPPAQKLAAVIACGSGLPFSAAAAASRATRIAQSGVGERGGCSLAAFFAFLPVGGCGTFQMQSSPVLVRARNA